MQVVDRKTMTLATAIFCPKNRGGGGGGHCSPFLKLPPFLCHVLATYYMAKTLVY